MIKSMTGYGKSELEVEERKYQVEIKSVNHRYLDISVKMPKQISYLEEDIKRKISEKIKRGKIDVFVTFENNSIKGKEIKINTEIAKAYIDELRKLVEQENLSSNIEVTEITKYPDVLSVQNIEDDDTIRNELLKTVEDATTNLVSMREIEGKRISEDLLSRINKVQEKVTEISSLSTGLIEEYVVKLESRIKEILKTEELDKLRLMQEVVIYADKCSIEEETTRLKSHISQLRNLINQNGPTGKKMDFLIQEMNRETNTIGSKSNSIEITNRVVDIKTILEDVREQIQNVE